MNLAVIPYHDWRKILTEGSRTRDSHFINHFQKSKEIENLIIINRPITITELFIKKRFKRIDGEVLYKERGCKLIKIANSCYVIDFLSNDFINHILLKRDWYFKAYCDDFFVSFIKKSYNFLNIKDINYISYNIYSAFLFNKLIPENLLFDAWDNYAKFPFSEDHLKKIKLAYHCFAKCTDKWSTNSIENMKYYQNHYGVSDINVIKNGVDLNEFQNVVFIKPTDIDKLQSPVIGFGGKITYLFDVKLYNYLLKNNKDKTFVIVGQIIDKKIFNQINKSDNFFYLGDKHYSVYPLYVQSFDICIVPYLVGDKAHGGDSIKAYEFLAAGKKTVGTSGNGLLNLKEYLYLHDSFSDFSDELSSTVNEKRNFDSQEYSWQQKSEISLEILNKKK